MANGFPSESELDFQAIFDAAPGIYLVLTPTFDIVAANAARLKATMATREATIGRNLFDAFPDNPDDPEATGTRNLRASLERVVRTKTADTMAVQKYDIPRPQSEGGGFEERYWSPMNSPVLGADGEVKYIIHRVEDVTDFLRLKTEGDRLQSHAGRIENEVYQRAQEVQEANRRFELANAELERLYARTKELDATKTRFFANISHELRTPLTLILGPVDRLLSEGGLDANQLRSLEVVGRNARLLLHHVNDLLDISKLDAGKMDVRYSEIDLARLLRAMCGHFESLAEDRGITFTVNAPESILAEIDSEKVQRVILNLLSNAFKFTPDNGQVMCELWINGDSACISVQDSGPGVPTSIRDLIFEPFRQGEEEATRRFGGTGLGLAIAREFLDLLGGVIGVRDAPSGGALFEVRLPLFAPVGANIVIEPRHGVEMTHIRHALDVERSGPAGAQPSRDKLDRALILVVEDNWEMNNFISEGLMEFYRVARAYNGREGLEKALELEPDLILSDMMMPEFSGEQLVDEIRARDAFDDTPIILLTAKADKETRVSLLRRGIQDVLTKPFNNEELLARVTNLLDAKKAGDAVRKGGRLSEEKRRLLMENARDAFLILSADGHVLEANKQADVLFGVANSTLEGRLFTDIARLRDKIDGVNTLRDLLAASSFTFDGVALELGPQYTLYADLSGRRLKVEDEEMIFVTLRDVGERVALQEQLRQSQKLEAMGQLTGGVAHDFNNLLTVIASASELLGSALDGQPKFAPPLDLIDRAVGRGVQLTGRLLAFARKQKLKLTSVDLNAIATSMRVMLERTLGEHIQIQVTLDSSLRTVVADAAQVEDALLNLAVNARDAMPGGGRLSIETRHVHLDAAYAAQNADVVPGDYGAIIVSDTGVGMPSEVIARAFEPFFTTKDVGHGTGLGLSMVYGFAKQAGGHLKILSEPGRGTSVMLYLPVSNVEDVENAATTPPKTGVIRGNGERVLVVEDDADVRAAAAALLTELGYHVREAPDGAAALAILQSADDVDLLFTDVVLPNGMSGFELVSAARCYRPGLKALFASGYSEDFVKQRDDLPTNTPLMTKPYRRDTLAEALNTVLARSTS